MKAGKITASDCLDGAKGMSGSETIREFLDSRNVFAVVGASRYPEKYGSRVYSDLKAAGYRVYPVNPRRIAYPATSVILI